MGWIDRGQVPPHRHSSMAHLEHAPAPPATANDVPIDLDGTPLDTREKLEAWIGRHQVALAEARARGECVG